MIYYETELYHHGILGMKWGVRRYQNKDGTRTALGKKRERVDAKKVAAVAGAAAGASAAGYGIYKLSKSDKAKTTFNNLTEQNIKAGKDKEKKSPAQVFATEGEKSIKNAADILKVVNKNKKQPNRAEGLSDEELRRRVNRIRLENDYNNLTHVETGMEKAIDALQVIGSVAAIGASAALIIGTAKKIGS